VTDTIVRTTRFGVWSGGRRVGVVEAENEHEAVRRFVVEVLGANQGELTPLTPDGRAFSWRGAGFRAEPANGDESDPYARREN